MVCPKLKRGTCTKLKKKCTRAYSTKMRNWKTCSVYKPKKATKKKTVKKKKKVAKKKSVLSKFWKR